MSVVLLRNKQAAEYPLLPQSVYDDFADPDVSVITMPKGRWQLPLAQDGVSGLDLTRSDVTVEASGCTLMVQPSVSIFLPLRVRSVPLVADPPYLRGAAHVHGTIVPSTTTLTMDVDEVIEDLAPGEQVVIECGVNPTDPNEPFDYLVASVASVDLDTRVITFTAPLGDTIVDYGDIDGLKLAVTEGQWTKLGEWGAVTDNGSQGRGWGTDHGIERFVGGMVHDVTVNDWTMRVDRVHQFEGNGSYAMEGISASAVQRLTVNRYAVHNPFSSVTLVAHCFQTVFDGFTTTGFGRSRLDQGSGNPAIAAAVWGGTGVTLRGLDLRSTDTMPVSCEISVRDLVLEDLSMDVDFTAVREFLATPIILGAFSVANRPILHNARLHVTRSGGAVPFYLFGNWHSTGVLNFDGPLLSEFNWGDGDTGLSMTFGSESTVILDGVTYGPPVTTTADLHATPNPQPGFVFFQDLHPPTGLYVFVGVEMVTAGGLSDIEMGGHVFADFADQAIVEVPAEWYVIPFNATPGQAIDDYRHLFVRVVNNGDTDGVIRFHLTYLPEVVV